MTDVRKIIVDRLKSLGWTKYRLAKEVAQVVTRQTVFNFLRKPAKGKKPAGINSRYVGPILDALALEIRPRDGR